MWRGAAAGIACSVVLAALLLLVSGGALAQSGPATRLAIYTDDWDCAYPPAMEGNLCVTLNGTDKIDETRVKLRIDGTPVAVRPRVIEGSRLVIFPLLYGAGDSDSTRKQNREMWSRLLGSPFSAPQVMAVRFDLEVSGRPVAGGAENDEFQQPTFRLLRYEHDWVIFGFAAAAVIVAGVILMGVRSSALRDRSPVCQVVLADLRFSLGKLQMAIWFCLIFAAFVFIWAVTGELGSLTSETFILLGISAGTALGSIAVDQSKASPAATVEAHLGAIGLQTARDVEKLRRLIANRQGGDFAGRHFDLSGVGAPDAEATQPTLADIERSYRDLTAPFRTQGFVRDLVNDATGATVHRFQMLAWTAILGVIYLFRVYWDLQMPEFGSNLLTLMGISGGVYLGFKVPER